MSHEKISTPELCGSESLLTVEEINPSLDEITPSMQSTADGESLEESHGEIPCHGHESPLKLEEVNPSLNEIRPSMQSTTDGEMSLSLESRGEMPGRGPESLALVEVNPSLSESAPSMQSTTDGEMSNEGIPGPGMLQTNGESSRSGQESSSSRRKETASTFPPMRDLKILRKLHVTKEDNVDMLIQAGGLRQDQVEIDENENDKDIEQAENIKGRDFSDGEDEDDEETGIKVPYDGASSLDVKLNLRDYQKELAKPALEGKNTIICAPTGCGKTRVAMDIIIKHLNEQAGARSKSRKVCFFARTVPLAHQQYKTIRDKLPEKYRINVFTGRSKQSKDFDMLLVTDVLVLTPMILHNHISKGNVRDLSMFSLFIFDECHHTIDKRPYNILMASYIKRKLLGAGHNLPQVVGLTASFSINNAKTAQEAVGPILQLCANLDAQLISVVVEHKEELQRLVPVPNESMEHLQERDGQESFKYIIDVMSKLEDDLRDYARDIGDFEISSTLSECRSPNRKSPSYYKWMVDLWDKTVLYPHSPNETNMAVRLLLVTTRFLMKYQSVLEIHDLVHLSDIVDYLDRCFSEVETGMEARLYESFKGLKERMQGLCHEENSNLRLLAKVIDEKLLKVSKEACGIIFVKTRAMAEALVAWLNRSENEEIRNLKASIFTGTNAPVSKGGTTKAQQMDLVQKFREQSVRLLVATSVAEEGIDFQECNLVIKYNHVGNEISTVQVRGRSRKAGGNSVLLALRNICDRERLNMRKVELMYEAIELVRRMSEHDFLYRLRQYQEEAQKKKEIEERTRSQERTRHKGKNFTMTCNLCRRFSVHSDNIRTIHDIHRVVVDRDVWKQKQISLIDVRNPEELPVVAKVKCQSDLPGGGKCREPMGAVLHYQHNFFLALAIEHFTIREDNQNVPTSKKKWKDLHYPLKEIELDDIDYYSQQDIETNTTVSAVQESGSSNASNDTNFIKPSVQETEPPGSLLSTYNSRGTHHETPLKRVVTSELDSGVNTQYNSSGTSIVDHTGETMSSDQLNDIALRYVLPVSGATPHSLSTYNSTRTHHETPLKECVMSELSSSETTQN